MTRRSWLLLVPCGLLPLKAASAVSVRGKLGADPQGRPVLQTDKGPVRLEADEPTVLVLHDKRLAGWDFEVAGKWKSAGVFAVDPIHTHSLFVHRAGKKLNVSYWCGICYIRTWSPGKCWCCQEDTELDPVDPATLEEKK